jgi:hypothetical protein
MHDEFFSGTQTLLKFESMFRIFTIKSAMREILHSFEAWNNWLPAY